MSLSAAAIRLLGAKGFTVAEIADVADANAPTKDAAADRRRAYDRERKRNSGGIPPEPKAGLSTGISTGIPPEVAAHTRAQVVAPSLPSLRSEELKTTEPNGSSVNAFSEILPEKPSTKAKPRNDYISASWVVSEALFQFGEQRGMGRQEINDAADEFRDYWGSRRDAKARRGDWDLSFKTRIRELAGRGRAGGARLAAAAARSRGNGSGSDSFADIYARRYGFTDD